MKAGLILHNTNGDFLLLRMDEQTKELAAKKKCFCRVFLDIKCEQPKIINDKQAVSIMDIDKVNKLVQVGHLDYNGYYWQNGNSLNIKK